VKLSRTNFGFFSLAGFATAVLAAGALRTRGDFAARVFLAAGFVVDLAGTRLTGARLAAAGGAFLAAVVVINKFPLQKLKMNDIYSLYRFYPFGLIISPYSIFHKV
jgi:hypothetical protein